MAVEQANKALRGIAAALLLAGMAVAQAPVVPSDHYGPPTCPGVTPRTHRHTLAEFTAEQNAGAADPHAILSTEPMENFGFSRLRIQNYADCVGDFGCYWADIDAQFKRAEAALKTAIAAHKSSEKLAIVLDIDETTLSSYCEMEREDYGFLKAMADKWTVTPEAAIAIPGGLRLFHQAKAAGVAIFFITGRPGQPDPTAKIPDADQTAATARNLEAAGYRGFTGLYLRNGEQNHISTTAYKSESRRRIVAQGYTLIMNVGDQWSDLMGDPQAEINVKLPDPFYFLP